MGSCCSTPPSNEILHGDEEEVVDGPPPNRLLLLGCGNSGKTTFVRQIKIIQNDLQQFTSKDWTAITEGIHYQTIHCMQELLRFQGKPLLETVLVSPSLSVCLYFFL